MKLVLFDIDGTLLRGDGSARRAFDGSQVHVFGTTRLSDHPQGRAFDTWRIDGRAVVDPRTPRALVEEYMHAAAAAGSYNVGGPYLLGSAPQWFSDRTHHDQRAGWHAWTHRAGLDDVRLRAAEATRNVEPEHAAATPEPTSAQPERTSVQPEPVEGGTSSSTSRSATNLGAGSTSPSTGGAVTSAASPESPSQRPLDLTALHDRLSAAARSCPSPPTSMPTSTGTSWS